LLFNPTNDFVSGFLQEQRLQLEFKAIKLMIFGNTCRIAEKKQTHPRYLHRWMYGALENFKFFRRAKTLTPLISKTRRSKPSPLSS
jgi:osmoprotectant transport system ATP-binding protein